MPQTQLIVLLVRCLLLIAVAPWLLAVGFGVHSAPGGAQEGWLLRVLFVSSDPLAIVELLGRSGALALAAAGLGVAAIAARTLERTRWGSSLIALPEAALALAGLVASAGVLAVGMAIDRPLFWGGLAILMLAWRPRPRPPRWTADDNASWRLILLVASAAVVLLAGETLLEGPGQRSPAFLLRGWWTNGPGQSGWTSGGIWLGLGIACVACARRGVGMGRVAAAVAVAGGVISTQGGPAEHYTIAAVTSAIGLLLVAWGLPAWIGDLPAPRGGPDVLDPRRLLSHAVPVIAWAAICAARGLTCFMWTVPTALPPGVTQIAQHGDVFSLGVDPGSGAVIYTDRERSRLGVLVDGVDREFDLGSTGPEEVLVLGPGAVWVSLVGHRGSGLVAVDLDTGPDVPARSVPGGCWIAGLFPMPEAAAEAAGLPSGSVAVGCEDAARLWLARQPLEIDGSRIVPHAVEEAVFAADGRSLYTVGLWSGWSLDRLAWPDGDMMDRATIGGFNWTLVARDDLLWVGRFFEGNLLAIDAETLEVVRTVPLSFGIRAMVHEPVHDRLWVSAAYSGLIWSISSADPTDRRAYALCGQSRDLVPTGDGAVIAATDCGLWRIEEPR